MEHEIYLKIAVEEALAGMRAGKGGPFGAVVVREGEVIGRGYNTVLASHDPTAHAEVNAIRNACRALKNHHLSGATIYSNFEPCPMCLSAIYWADIRSIFYCADRQETARAGFMDASLYEELMLPPEARKMRSTRIHLAEMSALLEEWKGMEGKVLY
jgi:tRNA(Arg) A34 adenosine deaminase TadA